MNKTTEKKTSGRSCFLYGCLSLLVVFVVAILALYFGVRYYVNSSIAKYTEATPIQFEPATLPDTESKALQERLKTFNQELQDTNKSAQISLDSRELNALMASDPKLADIKDRVRVQLEGDEVHCLVSVPLDPMSKMPFLGGLKGRYLNAKAKVRVALEDGSLTTKIAGLSVKDLELPAEALAEVEKNLPWEDIKRSPEMKELMGKIDWLKITDGKVELGTGKPAP